MEPLLTLQELDGRIRSLQQEIRDIPQRKENERHRLKEADDRRTAGHAELRAIQARIAECELGATAAREKIVKLRQQQMTLKTNREFRAMETEIAAAQRELDGHEADQIRAMDATRPVKERVEADEGRYREEKDGVDGYVEEMEGRHAEASKALGELEGQRVAAARLVDAAVLRQYERLRSSRWPVVVRLESGVCGGCHLTQPPAICHLVRRANAVVACQMCGRLLY